MKNKKPLFKIAAMIFSLLLSSCSLLPNMTPSRKRSSSEESEYSEEYSRSPKSSSPTTESTHKHTWGPWYEIVAPTCTEQGQKERECTVCHQRQTDFITALGHDYSTTYTIVAPSCEYSGVGTRECSRCHQSEDFVIDPLDHSFVQENGEDKVVWTRQPTCTESGTGTKTCTRCHEAIEVTVEPLGHDSVLIGGQANPPSGEAFVRLYKCNRCLETYLGFGVNQVSGASRERLLTGDWGGMRFYGRPIGNSLALDEMGVSINQQNNECVYCSTETGDFFEYIFTLNAEQASVLSTCRLYCDARPADHLSGDFWAYGNSITDWTPGYYIDGSDAHVQHNGDGTVIMVKDHAKVTAAGQQGVEINRDVPMGARVDKYRYVLYVDDVVQDFDSYTEVPVSGSGTNMVRKEYEMPYTFHLHEGQNKVRLCMAGGYRSEFFNFYFRPYVEPTPVQVNQESITINEGKTMQITSSMTGLTFASASTSIATVSDTGLVTGVKVGTTTITVSKEGNYRKTKIPVTVLEKEGVIALNLEDGIIAPTEGITVYNSASSGLWYRNFMKDVTLTYTFQSEKAGLFSIRLGLRGSNIVLEENIAIKVNGVDVNVSGTVSTSYSAVEYIVGQADLVVGENTMVITALQDNSLYLKTLKLVPVD